MMLLRLANKRFCFFLIPFVLWTSLILVFSFSTGAESTQQSNFVSEIILKILDLVNITLSDLMVGELNLWVRKLIGHFGMFVIDGLLAYFTLFFSKKSKPVRVFLWVTGFGILLSAFSEIAQLFTPDRAGLFWDVVIDIIGFTTGNLFAWFLSQWKRFKPKTMDVKA